jgi:hypothetical protein
MLILKIESVTIYLINLSTKSLFFQNLKNEYKKFQFVREK